MDPSGGIPSVNVEKEIYVHMVGVFEALTVFLEQAALYRLSGVKETLKSLRERLQQALRIIDLALESFEKLLDRRAWEKSQRFLERVEDTI